MSKSATIRITAQVDVYVGDWGDKASFESLREQVIREGKQKLQNALQKNPTDFHVGKVTAVHVVLSADEDKQ